MCMLCVCYVMCMLCVCYVYNNNKSLLRMNLQSDVQVYKYRNEKMLNKRRRKKLKNEKMYTNVYVMCMFEVSTF